MAQRRFGNVSGRKYLSNKFFDFVFSFVILKKTNALSLFVVGSFHYLRCK